MGTHFHSPDADMPEIIGDTACPATAAAVPNMPSSICRPSIIWPAPRIEIGKGVGRSTISQSFLAATISNSEI
jgi:hypothetical protein